MAIVIELVSRSGSVVSIKSFNQDEVVIGRGFDSQVILHDPHVDPQHLKLSRDPVTGALKCQDLNTLNGTWFAQTNKKGAIHKRGRKVSGDTRFYSGQTLQLGKSYIRVYDTHHHVSETLPLSQWEETSHKLDHWWLWSVLTLCLVVLQVWDSYLSQPLAAKLSQNFLKACYPLLGAFVYAGIFAFLGRNYKHDPKLGSHFSIAVAVILALSLTDFVSPYFSAWLSIQDLSGVFGEVIWMATIFGGCYLSLALATPLKKTARVVAACVIPVTLMISLLIGILSQPQFKRYAEYDRNLIEPAWQSHSTVDVKTFVNQTDDLFVQLQSDE